MIDPRNPIFNLRHFESDSMMYLQLTKKQNKMVIDKVAWAKGNVVSLVDVRKALQIATQQLIGPPPNG